MDRRDLSETIGAIYDCALEPGLWPKALERIGTLCRSSMEYIALHDVKTRRIKGGFVRGGDEDFLAKYQKDYASLNPIIAAGWLRPIGEVYSLDTLFEEKEEWYESRFYREFWQPAGMYDIMGFMGIRSGDRVAWVVVQRKDDPAKFSAAEKEIFGLLSPHICRCIKISDAIDLQTIRSETLKSALDSLSTAVFLLDSQGRVVYANNAGGLLARKSNALRIVNDRLTPLDGATDSALVELLNRVVSQAENTAHSIAFPSKGGDDGLLASVLPLDRGERRSLIAPWAARIAVFVQSEELAPQIPGEAFAKLHGLSGAELRVLLTIAPGLSIKEAADMLGLSENTIKSHVGRLLQKTGTSKQTELVRLLIVSVPPVRG